MAALYYLASLVLLSVAHAKGGKDDDLKNLQVTHEVHFDVEVKDYDGPGEDFTGTFVIALFGEVCPMTTMNFVQLADGSKNKQKSRRYKNTKIHRIVRDFVIQMGDVDNQEGKGGYSAFGGYFDDENFILSHKAAGYVAMANHGKDTNGSQFFILVNKARWLDGKHVVFGKVVKGMKVIRALNDVPTERDTALPKKQIKIVDCGSQKVDYKLNEKQQNSNDDM